MLLFLRSLDKYIIYFKGMPMAGNIKIKDNFIAVKQDRLVSGTNIKTPNGQSILGTIHIAVNSSDTASLVSCNSNNPSIQRAKGLFVQESKQGRLFKNIFPSSPMFNI